MAPFDKFSPCLNSASNWIWVNISKGKDVKGRIEGNSNKWKEKVGIEGELRKSEIEDK